jgi:hypothetical protein
MTQRASGRMLRSMPEGSSRAAPGRRPPNVHGASRASDPPPSLPSHGYRRERAAAAPIALAPRRPHRRPHCSLCLATASQVARDQRARGRPELAAFGRRPQDAFEPTRDMAVEGRTRAIAAREPTRGSEAPDRGTITAARDPHAARGRGRRGAARDRAAVSRCRRSRARRRSRRRAWSAGPGAGGRACGGGRMVAGGCLRVASVWVDQVL